MQSALKDLKKKTGELPPPLAVAKRELEGQIALASKKEDKGFDKLQAAVRGERTLRYNEPPSYPRPVAEALGRRALESGKLQIAEEAFRIALDQFPESAHARAGLAETLKREGKAVPAGL